MAIIKKDGNYMGLPMNIARGNPIPLDTTEIWYSLSELEIYAKSGATAYVGQIVQLVDEANGTATAYIIANTDGDLLEVGSSTAGDGKTIELTDEGILRIVGASEATVGAQLVMGDGGIVKWVKPDTTTVESLATTVDTLQKSVESIDGRVTATEDEIDDIQATLSGMGAIFNFAGSYTVDQVVTGGAADVANFDAGDVILVDGTKEYVCVEIDGTKRWEILGDPSGVTALEGKVSSLETWKTSASASIATLETDVATAKTNITTLTDKDTELENAIKEKASQTDLDSAVARIKVNEDNIKDLQAADEAINTALNSKATTTYVDNKIADVNSSLSGKADQADLDDVIASMATDSELEAGLAGKVDATTYNEKVAELETGISDNSTAITAVTSTANKNKEDIASLTTSLGDKASASDLINLANRVSANEQSISSHTSSINTLTGAVTGLESNKADKTALTTLEGKVTANTEAISAHAAEYTALADRVTTAEADVDKAQEDATKALNDAAGAQTAADTAKSAADDAMAKAEAVLGTTADEPSANTVYGAKAAAAAAQTAADDAQADVDALSQTVTALDEAYKTADQDLQSQIDAIETVIGGVQGAMHFVGVSTTDPSAGSVVIEGRDDYSPVNGDVVIYKDDDDNTIEYIYSDGSWVELGDVSAEAKRIESLETRMTAAEVQTAKVPTIESNIEAVQTAAAALEARVKANETNITSHASSIAALESRMTEAEESITSTAATLRSELAAKAEELSGDIEAEATARASADEALQGQIDTINSQLTWNKMTSV